jgi:AraC-like DNA-binding protein
MSGEFLAADEMNQRESSRLEIASARPDGPQIAELFARPAFYAEFAPLPQHSADVDHLYVLKDCGLLTADRREFASPFAGLSFVFRKSAERSGYLAKVAVIHPSFGHRKRDQTFHGWAFGIKSKTSQWPSEANATCLADCQTRLAQAIGAEPSHTDILDILDRLLDGLTRQSADRASDVYDALNVPQFRVDRLATRLGRSGRTLQRRVRTATGLPPKRFLAVERFRRAVHDISVQPAKLSLAACKLGFSDQAHLTREFRRHAGVTPGAFQQAWHGTRGKAVRFVQDGASPTRLRVAVWPAKDQR